MQNAQHPRSTQLGAAAVSLLLATSSAPALGQSCSYNPSQPNAASFGTIDPTLTASRTFSITLNYKCTAGATAVFAISGANDSGPGAHRMKNTVEPTRFLPYSINTVNEPGSKITLNGLLVAADYQNAWVGSYTDSLTVLVLP
jgi:spore coat protein U-like protein